MIASSHLADVLNFPRRLPTIGDLISHSLFALSSQRLDLAPNCRILWPTTADPHSLINLSEYKPSHHLQDCIIIQRSPGRQGNNPHSFSPLLYYWPDRRSFHYNFQSTAFDC